MPANFLIRKATLADLDAIAASYSELLAYEKTHGVHTNWVKGVYPKKEIPEQKILANSAFTLVADNELCASMALDSWQAPEYNLINWRFQAPAAKVLVIHTLVIRPSKSRRGYGGAMLEYAKDFGSQNDFSVIRIDTWIHNEPAKNLYLKHGFTVAGYGPISLHGLNQNEVYLEYKL